VLEIVEREALKGSAHTTLIQFAMVAGMGSSESNQSGFVCSLQWQAHLSVVLLSIS